MTQAYALLVDNVNLVRKSWHVRRVLEGIVLLLAAAGGVLLLAAILDTLFDFGSFFRWLLFLCFIAVAGFVIARFIAKPLNAKHSDDFFAALIEQRHPNMRNRLINALQLGRDANIKSPRLVEAIVADGATAVDELDPARAVSTPAIKHFGIALAVVAVVWAFYTLLAGPAVTASVQRVLLPWADIMPFTWTTVTVTPSENLSLLEGSSLDVTAVTGGRFPEDASLTLIDGLHHRRTLRMTPDATQAHQFAYKFASVEAPFSFYVAAGDATSREVSVKVEPRPRVTKMSVVYHYPAYTGLADRKLDEFDGHLHGLPNTKATLSLTSNKPLEKVALIVNNAAAVPAQSAADGSSWSVEVPITANGIFFFKLLDKAGNNLDDPGRYTVTVDQDMPPAVGFAKPGRDIQVRPDESIDFVIVAQDDFGVGLVKMAGRVTPDRGVTREAVTLNEWPNNAPKPERRLDLSIKKTVAELGLKPGDRLEYWAVAEDRNAGASEGPGRAESRRFNILVLTGEQAAVLIEKQLSDYAKELTELIRLQRLTRAQTQALAAAAPLIKQQDTIRVATTNLAKRMEANAFQARTMVDELYGLASEPMPRVITQLEGYRDAGNADTGKELATNSLPTQDEIVAKLEDILKRINRDQVVRADLKKMATDKPAEHGEVKAVASTLAKDLDKFLNEQRELKEKYEKMSKRDGEDAKGEDLAALNDAAHRLDRWKQWAKDSIDGLAKLPEGFVKDAALAETLQAIFEETEKKDKGATQKIETPSEEGMKIIATKVLEDLEVWMMDHGDSAKFVMEEPPEGKFEVQPSKLSSDLQDLIGDLVEDVKDFDEEADDVTSSWGGDMPQGGWDITDGPISTFSAQGKTGNQLPNAQEATGRAGSGRRGRSGGQMAGDESKALEGRPTPARVTNEKYEAGAPKADKQLDPRGSTGGGKKTGGGARGLQGGNKPDFVKEMNRLADNQAILREKTEQIAKQLETTGRSSSRVNRALQLMEGAESDLRDLRYEDAARKRKTAINELKAEENQIDEAVSVTLQRAANIPPEMRQQITAGSQQALPEGYEDLVGAYYKALSGAAEKK